MITVIVVCIIIVAAVTGLSIWTTSKGYAYKHTVDPLPEEKEDKEDKDSSS